MSARPGEHARAAGRAASRPAPAPARAARPRPWRDHWQLVPVALLMYALVAVDRFRRGAQAAGLVHAVTINRLSRPVGGAALAMNHWLIHHLVPAAAAAAYYMVLQVLVTAAGIWLLGSGHPSFRLHRDALIVTGVIGLMVFWVYPVAPPRMLPGYHDTVDAIGPLFSHQLETKAADAFAAFSSLHVTWALWVAVVCQALVRRRIWRAAVWAYPAATTIDVLATAVRRRQRRRRQPDLRAGGGRGGRLRPGRPARVRRPAVRQHAARRLADHRGAHPQPQARYRRLDVLVQQLGRRGADRPGRRQPGRHRPAAAGPPLTTRTVRVLTASQDPHPGSPDGRPPRDPRRGQSRSSGACYEP